MRIDCIAGMQDRCHSPLSPIGRTLIEFSFTEQSDSIMWWQLQGEAESCGTAADNKDVMLMVA